MSEVETNAIPADNTAVALAEQIPVPATAPVATAPALKKNAIQLIEEQIVNFFKQREEAIAKVHAIDGALQSSQHLLAIFRAEAAKAEAEVKAVVAAVENEAKKL